MTDTTPLEAESEHTAAVIVVGGGHQASCSCGWFGDAYSIPGPAEIQARRHLFRPGVGGAES